MISGKQGLRLFAAVLLLLGSRLPALDVARPAQELQDYRPSAAYQWLDILQEACARDVERIGARPTILSRQMAIVLTAMYDAWAAYDDKAVGTRLFGELRRPPAERTRQNKETAVAYAAYRSMIDQLPDQLEYITQEMKRMGYDPLDQSMDVTTPQGIGNKAAAVLLAYRHHDGANQLGDEIGSNGKPYSDYTMYSPVNTPEKVIDPDRWQPLPFSDGKGGVFYPGFLTPQWYRVKPFGMESTDQFRPGPQPKVGSEQLQKDIDECIQYNSSLTIEQKAVVEFMRDGPRSTGQSGHWLRFAQVVSRRDKNDLDTDIKLFFAVGNAVFDGFISCWDAKRYYDSSRPWTLIRWYYKGRKIRGWLGPGKGVGEIPAEEWIPYSPATFITPPFPGYTSGHSTVSAAAAEMLKLFTGSDVFDADERRRAGVLTEQGFDCDMMMQVDGTPLSKMLGKELNCDVVLPLPTFRTAAEMAALSRMMGGYHISTDNNVGLEYGVKVSQYIWPKIESYFNGTATPEGLQKLAESYKSEKMTQMKKMEEMMKMEKMKKMEEMKKTS